MRIVLSMFIILAALVLLSGILLVSITWTHRPDLSAFDIFRELVREIVKTIKDS